MEEYDLALNISPIDSEIPNNNFQDDLLALKNLRVSYLNNIIIGHLNINFIVLALNRYSVPPHIEILFFELNLRNQKWLVCCSYNPHKSLIKEHLRVLTERIQFYSKDYENILLMGDYNAEIAETNMSSFCEISHQTNIIKQPTCFKSFKSIMHRSIFN